MEVFRVLSNTWDNSTTNRLGINMFHKAHGNAGKSCSIHVTKRSTRFQSINILRPTIMASFGKNNTRTLQSYIKSKIELNLEVNSFSDSGT